MHLNIVQGEPPRSGHCLFTEEFQSRIDRKQAIVDAVANVILSKGWVGGEDSHWLFLCIDEAVVNAMLHGNEGDPTLMITVSIYADDDKWSVIISDQGEGFKAEVVPDVDDPKSLLLEHGRGIHIMKQWLDDLTYYRNGSCVYMARKKQANAIANALPPPEGEKMSCDFLIVQTYDNIVLAKIEKDRLLDIGSIKSLSDALTALLDRHPKISLVLDMSAVGYLSSAMLGKLVSLHKSVRANNGRMAVGGVKAQIMPLFKITKLDKLFELYGDAQEALLLYKRKPL